MNYNFRHTVVYDIVFKEYGSEGFYPVVGAGEHILRQGQLRMDIKRPTSIGILSIIELFRCLFLYDPSPLDRPCVKIISGDP
jgi:hypothetical protein